MRVLLDECVPRGLRTELSGHEVSTVAEAAWAGVKNGELLRLAATRFDVLLTVDRNFEYQQNVSGVAIAVVVVDVSSNDIAALHPYTRGGRDASQSKTRRRDARPQPRSNIGILTKR